jgi:hypothetical protein
MENKNAYYNLVIKQVNQSNSMAYDDSYVASSTDSNFRIIDKAYAGTATAYAKFKMAIDSNKCKEASCEYETKQLQQLKAFPKKSLEFIELVVDQLAVTDMPYYDVNNNYVYMVANYMINSKPGFSKTEGYNIELFLLENGSQELVFEGPLFDKKLIINSSTLTSLIESGTDLIAETPDINKDMLRLLTEVGIFSADMVGENGELTASAAISDEFVLKVNGQPDYEIIDIGNGKGRNVLRYDMDKIERKVTPFINAEVAGILSQEQEAVAAWNVFIAKGTSVEEDDQMAQNANAGSKAWSYEKDLPLMPDKKETFESKYKDYFMNNYLSQFTTNKLPTVEEDAAIFDLEKGRQAKADKFIQDNKLS